MVLKILRNCLYNIADLRMHGDFVPQPAATYIRVEVEKLTRRDHMNRSCSNLALLGVLEDTCGLVSLRVAHLMY